MPVLIVLLLCLWCVTGLCQTVTFSIEGDSISDTDENRWPHYFEPMMQTKFDSLTLSNWARSGDTVSNMAGQYGTQAHALAPGTNLGFFILWAGINNAASNTVQESMVESNFSVIWLDARTDGYLVAAVKYTPNYNWPTGDPRWQSYSNIIGWMVQQTNSYQFMVPMADVLAQPDLIDGLHPTACGAIKAALEVSNVLFNGDATMTIPGSEVVLSGVPGNTYSLQTSTNLTDWMDVQTNLVPSTGLVSYGESETNLMTFFRSRFVR